MSQKIEKTTIYGVNVSKDDLGKKIEIPIYESGGRYKISGTVVGTNPLVVMREE